MDQWITERWEEIREIYANSQKVKNSALMSFSVYMLRLLNGLEQMRYSQFHIYEKEVLWQAMMLFSRYYVEQARIVLQGECCLSENQEIMEDLEEAVYQISNVYKNVVDSTANADRQIFTTLTVDTNMYDLSPRLCMFYTGILENLVDFFDCKEEYAFLLYPTLKSNIETQNLFRTRNDHGKVVLIYIPENRIEDIDMVPVYLLHEAFHTLSSDPRLRKKRSACLLENMILGVKQLLFLDVQFDGDQNADDAVKEKLLEKWFPITSWIDPIKKKNEDDRFFYSEQITDWLCRQWEEQLRTIFGSLGKDLVEVIADTMNASETDQKIYQEKIRLCLQAETLLRRNLIDLLSKNLIQGLADTYIHFYRESYADIACILTLGLEPERYVAAFRKSISYMVSDKEYKDNRREIRISVVADAISNCNNRPLSNTWRNYIKTHQNIQSADRFVPICRHVEIEITEQDTDAYIRYLRACAEKLETFFTEKIKGIEEFRNIIKNVRITEILSGKTAEDLKRIKKMGIASATEKGSGKI